MNYSLVVNNIGDKANETVSNGPYGHQGPGVVSQYIRGLRKNNRYSVQVLVDSVTGSAKSNNVYFGKYHFDGS